MQTVKYKIWDNLKREWVKQRVWSDVYEDGVHEVKQHPQAHTAFLFTGFADEKGKDIYDGDILCVDIPGASQKAAIKRVFWNSYIGAWVVNDPRLTFLSNCQNIKIMGNICDNPEYL